MKNSSYIVLFSLLIFAGAFVLINYTTDDPFITYRYSENLFHGKGLVYNEGERVEGYSNPTWVFIMAGLYPIASGLHPLAILWFAKVLGILLTIVSVLVFYRAETGVNPRQFPVGTFFLALNPALMLWSVGGLETALCVLLASIILYDEVINNGSIMGAAAVGVLGVSRPEMPLIVIVYLIWRWLNGENAKAGMMRIVLVSIIPAALWVIFRLIYYGDIFPSTYYAKAQSHDVFNGVIYLLFSLRLVNFFYMLLPLTFAGLIRNSRKGWLFSITISAAYVLFIVLAGGDWMPGARLLIHISPFLAWVAASGREKISSLIGPSRTRLLPVVILILMVAGNLLSYKQIHKKFVVSLWPWEKFSVESPVYPHYNEMGTWMAENTDPDSYAALGEAGLIPFLSHNRIIDCFGLMDPHIARLPGKLHYKFDAEYVMSREPDYILLLGTFADGDFDGRFLYCRELYRHPDFAHYTLEHNVNDIFLFHRDDALKP